jgi:hypothetical protein
MLAHTVAYDAFGHSILVVRVPCCFSHLLLMLVLIASAACPMLQRPLFTPVSNPTNHKPHQPQPADHDA